MLLSNSASGISALSLELEQAQYEARLAARRYEAVDPDNRLVAAELEARWNASLQIIGEVEQRLRQNELPDNAIRIPDKETLCSLAQDLPAVWNSPATDMRLKQRIVRILVEEIVADVDAANAEIVLLIHWTGGRHSELRLRRTDGQAQPLHQSGSNRDYSPHGGQIP